MDNLKSEQSRILSKKLPLYNAAPKERVSIIKKIEKIIGDENKAREVIQLLEPFEDAGNALRDIWSRVESYGGVNTFLVNKSIQDRTFKGSSLDWINALGKAKKKDEALRKVADNAV